MKRTFVVELQVGFANVEEAGAFFGSILGSFPNSLGRVVALADHTPDIEITPAGDSTPVTTGAEDAPPAAEGTQADVSGTAEPAPLTLPEQKEAKDRFNKFARKDGIKAGQALLAKYEARRWSDLTPVQMAQIVAELPA